MSVHLKAALEGGRTPASVPCTSVCALFVPKGVHIGNTFQDMVGSTVPAIDAYSKVLQVFFALATKVPNNSSGDLFFETIVTPDGDVELGTRYILALDGQNVVSDLDGIAEKEIIGHWESVCEKPGVNKKNYKKTHGEVFGSQWKVFFQGVDDWRRSLFAVFDDIEPQDAETGLASRVFAFDASFRFGGACAEQSAVNNYFDPASGALVFPRPTLVRPIRNIQRAANMKYGDVLVRELKMTRVSPGTVVSLAAQFVPVQQDNNNNNNAAAPPPANRHRGPAAAAAAAPGRWHAPLVKPPSDVHRFLPLAPLAQSIKVIKNAIDKVADPKARYILSSFCNSQMGDAYLHALRTSDQRSPGDIAMMDYATQTVDGIPTTSCYWNSRWLPVYEAMSTSEALISKCIAALEIYYSVDMCHHEALMLLLGAPDCFRLAFETMKFSAWIYSKGGGVSKSFMLSLVRAISVKGMVKMIGRFTAAAFAVNGTEENPKCPNQTMQVIGIDDTAPGIFDVNPKDEKSAAALKSAMTAQVASVDTMKFTDDGDRLKKFIEAPLGGVFIVLANVDRIESQPLERRAQNLAASEVASSTIDETVVQSWEVGLDGRQQSFSTEIRWLQYCQYMISTLQYAGLLPEFTYGAAGVILLELSAALKKDDDIKTFTRIDTSVLQRIKSYARLLEIDKICLDAFCAVQGEYRAIGVADFLKLAPRMYISVESICNAAMFLLDGWLPSLRFVVSDALRLFVASKASNAVGDRAGPSVVNQTHVRFDFAEVVNFIVATVPSMTRNFTPNYATVATHLRTFLSLKAEDSATYRPSPDLNGKVIRETANATLKVRPFIESPRGFGVSNFDIAICHYEDILAHKQRDFSVLSGRFIDALFDTFAGDASRKLAVSENQMKHMRCEDMPCATCMAEKETTGARDMTANVFELLERALASPDDLPFSETLPSDDEKAAAVAQARERFIKSFLWDPSLPTVDPDTGAPFTVRDMVEKVVAGRYGVSERRMEDHFSAKMRVYLTSSFRMTMTTKRWERIPDAPLIQWFETARSATVEVGGRPESEYSSASYEKVAKILANFLNNKNQLPRRIFAGPDPQSKYQAKYVEVGGCAVHDPSKAVLIKLKNRNCKFLGKVDLAELTKLIGNLDRVVIPVNYDLDIWTQERHFEALGIDPTVTISASLMDDLGNLLKAGSARYDGRFVNGVPAKDLAPVEFNEIPAIAAAIKVRLAQAPLANEEDIFFPRAQIDRKVAIAIARGIPPQVFKLPNYDGDNKTMCFAALWQQHEEYEELD
jgi:hypothetical protein